MSMPPRRPKDMMVSETSPVFVRKTLESFVTDNCGATYHGGLDCAPDCCAPAVAAQAARTATVRTFAARRGMLLLFMAILSRVGAEHHHDISTRCGRRARAAP